MPRVQTNVPDMVAFIEAAGFDATDAKSLVGQSPNQGRVFAALLNSGMRDREQLHNGLVAAQREAKIGAQHVGYYLSHARHGSLDGFTGDASSLSILSTGRKRTAQEAAPAKPAKSASTAPAAAASPAPTAKPPEVGSANELAELQALAKANGIPSGGNTKQLRARLKAAMG